MSYKPTRSRKYKVSPVGTAQSVGFQVSRELDSIASNLSNIGTNFRKAQFEEAKRKAISESQINAVNYTTDKDGNVTLNNLSNFEFDSGLNDQRDANQMKSFYQTNLITNYGNALTKDVNAFVNNYLAQNPLDFKGLMAKKDGYIKGKNLDINAELKATVLPNINASFLNGANKAKANYTKFKREENLANVGTTMDLHTAELMQINAGAIYNNSVLDPDKSQRAKEIYAEFDKQKAVWLTNGGTESDWNTLVNNKKTQIVLHTNKVLLKDIFEKKGADDAFNFINDLNDKLTTNPKYFSGITINQKLFVEGLSAEFSNLQTAKSLKDKEIAKEQTSNFNNLNQKIKLGEILSIDDILASNTSMAQKNALIDNNQGNINKQKTINSQEFQELFNQYQFPNSYLSEDDGVTVSDIRQNADIQIEEMYTKGLIQEKQYNTFLQAEAKLLSDQMKNMSKHFISNLRRITSPTFGYRQKPGDILIEINKMRAADKIRPEDESSIQSIMNTYKSKYTKFWDTKKKLLLAQNYMISGFPVPAELRDAVIEKEHKLSITVVGEDGSDQTVQLDLLSGDENIYNESFLVASVNTKATKVLHPAFANVFNNTNFVADEDIFNRTINMYNNLKIQFDQRDKPGSGKFTFFNVLKNANVDYTSLENAQFLGFNDFRALKTEGVNLNRKLSSLGITNVNEFEQKVRTVIPDALKDNTFFSFLPFIDDNNLTHHQNTMLDKYRAQTESDNLSDVFLGNSRVSQIIMEKVRANYSQSKYQGNDNGFRMAVTDTFVELSGKLGLQENENGQVEWTFFPIMEEAKKSMYGFGLPEIEDKDMIMSFIKTDAIDKITKISAFRSPELSEAINDGNIKFIVNEPFTTNPSYTVFATLENGENVAVMDNYRYDFRVSVQNKDYQNALSQVKNATIRNMINNVIGLRESYFRDVFLDLAENRNYDTFIRKLTGAYNRLSPYINQVDPPIIDENDIDAINNVLEYIPGY